MKFGTEVNWEIRKRGVYERDREGGVNKCDGGGGGCVGRGGRSVVWGIGVSQCGGRHSTRHRGSQTTAHQVQMSLVTST